MSKSLFDIVILPFIISLAGGLTGSFIHTAVVYRFWRPRSQRIEIYIPFLLNMLIIGNQERKLEFSQFIIKHSQRVKAWIVYDFRLLPWRRFLYAVLLIFSHLFSAKLSQTVDLFNNLVFTRLIYSIVFNIAVLLVIFVLDQKRLASYDLHPYYHQPIIPDSIYVLILTYGIVFLLSVYFARDIASILEVTTYLSKLAIFHTAMLIWTFYLLVGVWPAWYNKDHIWRTAYQQVEFVLRFK